MSLMNSVFTTFVAPRLEKPLRRGAIQTVKGYIQAVRLARSVALAAVYLGLATGLITSGLALIIAGGIQFLPITPQAMWLTMIGVGLLMIAVPSLILLRIFSTRHWLEASHANELIAAVLAPWDGIVPPNPADVMRGEGPHATVQKPTPADAPFTQPVAPLEEGAPLLSQQSMTIADELDSVAASMGIVSNGPLPVLP